MGDRRPSAAVRLPDTRMRTQAIEEDLAWLYLFTKVVLTLWFAEVM